MKKQIIALSFVASLFFAFSANAANQSSHSEVKTNIKQVKVATSVWPENAIVGYIMAWDINHFAPGQTGAELPSTQLVKDAIDKGYNVIVYSMIAQESDNNATLDDFLTAMKEGLNEQINHIHKNRGLVLASVGILTTFAPNTDEMTKAGSNMAELLYKNGFDGLDLDIETLKDTSLTADNMQQYITSLKQRYLTLAGKDIILTAAPQVRGVDKKLNFYPSSLFTEDFLKKANFTAIFPQIYNQFIKLQINGEPLSSRTNLYLPQVSSNIISFIYNNIKTLVPATTKIAIAFPAAINETYLNANGVDKCIYNLQCAGICSVYKPKDILQQISSIKTDVKYGGVMTWAINFDAKNSWKWISMIKPGLKKGSE